MTSVHFPFRDPSPSPSCRTCWHSSPKGSSSLPFEKAEMLRVGIKYVETYHDPQSLLVKFLFFSFPLHWLYIFQGNIFSASANTLNPSGPPGDHRHSWLVDAHEGQSGHTGERKGLLMKGSIKGNAALEPLRGNLFLKLGTEKYLRIKIWFSI